jgi:hypothetical protein
MGLMRGAVSAACGCVFVEVVTITLKHQTQLTEDHKQPKGKRLSYEYTGSRSSGFHFIFLQFHKLALLKTMRRRRIAAVRVGDQSPEDWLGV